MCTLLRTYTGHMLYSTSNARTEPPTMQHTTNQARAWKPYLENDMLFARAHIRRLEDVNCGVHPVHGATNRQTASTHAYLHAGYMHTCINYTHEHIQSYTNMQARKHPNKHTHTHLHTDVRAAPSYHTPSYHTIDMPLRIYCANPRTHR